MSIPRSILAPIVILATSIAALAQAPATPAPAAAPAAPAPPVFKALVSNIDLKDGDTWVFLGDSITHQCLYTQYVEDYFYTRYPKKKINFHNAGVGGDRAADALRRFDEDVAAYKPKYVTILLGMNDGSYRDFDKAVFDTYQKDMTTVLEQIAGIGAASVPMTPTMFDTRAKRISGKTQEPRDTYYNGVLSLFGTWLREQTETRGLGFVDMWSPLNNLTLQQRKKEPNFTLIKDGVHPDAPGQVVMAAAVINDMVARSMVSKVEIDVAAQPKSKVANGKVTELAKTDNGVSFTLEANSLPWVLPSEASLGAKLTKIGHKFSNEKLIVRALATGSYELKIDGKPVGTYTDAQLSTGIELQENDKTPQYQQALQVAMLNKQRNDTAYRPLRDQYGQLKGRRRDITKAEQTNDPQLAAKKTEFEAWYVTQKAKVAELRAAAKGFEEKIYATNQPKPHKYELSLVK